MNIVNGLPQSTVISHESITVSASKWITRSSGTIYAISKPGIKSTDIVIVAPDYTSLFDKSKRAMIAEAAIYAVVESDHIVLVADGPKPTQDFRVLVTIFD